MYLDKERQNEIDEVINSMLFNAGVTFPKGSIGELLIKLNIPYSSSANLPEYVSGVVVFRDEKYCIAANKNDSLKRRVFTLAHELGHLMLKHPMEEGQKYRFDKYYYLPGSPEEREENEANYFAASLLVPKEKLIWAMDQTADLHMISDYFGISEIVIRNRCHGLVI